MKNLTLQNAHGRHFPLYFLEFCSTWQLSPCCPSLPVFNTLVLIRIWSLAMYHSISLTYKPAELSLHTWLLTVGDSVELQVLGHQLQRCTHAYRLNPVQTHKQTHMETHPHTYMHHTWCLVPLVAPAWWPLRISFLKNGPQCSSHRNRGVLALKWADLVFHRLFSYVNRGTVQSFLVSICYPGAKVSALLSPLLISRYISTETWVRAAGRLKSAAVSQFFCS